MKVIVAGFSKTGTKSMYEALTKLGYTVYDVMENMYLLEAEWTKILNDGWTTEDFRRMYENVDAVTDLPAAYFWEEIHKAFPEAKIILTTRDEDKWFKSFVKQYESYDGNLMVRLCALLSPTFRRVERNITVPLSRIVCGMRKESIFRVRTHLHEHILRMKYRAHNAHVLQNAPLEKLLVYCVADGWEPLCKFLNLPMPDEPFPHKNKGGDIVSELMKTNSTMKKMEREFMMSLLLIVSSTALGGYFTYKHGFMATVTSPVRYFSRLAGWE